jgi:hypothetical protein
LFRCDFVAAGTLDGRNLSRNTIPEFRRIQAHAGQALQRAFDKSSVTENNHCVVGVGLGGRRGFSGKPFCG